MSVGLVLEGGGQRGAYTAGVLQGLWSEGICLDYVVGVSAGALTGINYVSGQLRRNYDTFVKYSPDPRYMGFRHIRDHGSFFNFDFLLGDIIYDLLPFDFEAFFSSPCRMRIGTTDCRTGEAVYFDKESLREDPALKVLRATASLPLVSDMVSFRGRDLLDGGIADPIPLQRSARRWKRVQYRRADPQRRSCRQAGFDASVVQTEIQRLSGVDWTAGTPRRTVHQSAPVCLRAATQRQSRGYPACCAAEDRTHRAERGKTCGSPRYRAD